jgi:hypothetical protein
MREPLYTTVCCAPKSGRALLLGDMRHDAAVPLAWVGLVSSRVSARVCLWCDGVGERGASRHVRGGSSWACENVKNLVCVIRATYDAVIVGAVSSAVSRVLCRSIAIADVCRRAALRCAALRCGCCVTAQRCVRLCSRLIVHVCVSRCSACTRALPPRCSGGAVLRVCCRWRRRRRRSLAVHVAH